jgi:lipopolysaccharide/colanic/teichoic acid biosynthesis glycosyltransferase
MIEMVDPVIHKKKLHSKDNDFQYWKSKSMEERLDAIEFLRQSYMKTETDVQQRLQRVYRIIRKTSG